MYRYYAEKLLEDVNSYPEGAQNVHDFGKKKFRQECSRHVYGYLDYEKPLTKEQQETYGLRLWANLRTEKGEIQTIPKTFPTLYDLTTLRECVVSEEDHTVCIVLELDAGYTSLKLSTGYLTGQERYIRVFSTLGCTKMAIVNHDGTIDTWDDGSEIPKKWVEKDKQIRNCLEHGYGIRMDDLRYAKIENGRKE